MPSRCKNDILDIVLWIREGHADIVQFLIVNNADVTKKDYKDRNPLEVAIEMGNQKAVKTIITSSQWKEAMRSSRTVSVVAHYRKVRHTSVKIFKILRKWTLP